MAAWFPESFQSMSSASRPSQEHSDPSKPADTTDTSLEEVDTLLKQGGAAVHRLIFHPPQLEPPDVQAPPVLVDRTRNALSAAVLSCLQIQPQTVILHVYDLNNGVVQANAVGAFGVGMGGAFHVGTEVYGGEWAYGTRGVSCDPPRLLTSHKYNCSVIVGTTELDRLTTSEVLSSLVQQWSGLDYDTLGHNCCAFAAELCAQLGVGPMPPWVDRFSRLLHGGRKAGQDVGKKAAAITQEASRLAQSVPTHVQPHMDYAAQMGKQVLEASKSLWQQADQHAQTMLTRFWTRDGDEAASPEMAPAASFDPDFPQPLNLAGAQADLSRLPLPATASFDVGPTAAPLSQLQQQHLHPPVSRAAELVHPSASRGPPEIQSLDAHPARSAMGRAGPAHHPSSAPSAWEVYEVARQTSRTSSTASQSLSQVTPWGGEHPGGATGPRGGSQSFAPMQQPGWPPGQAAGPGRGSGTATLPPQKPSFRLQSVRHGQGGRLELAPTAAAAMNDRSRHLRPGVVGIAGTE